MLRSFLVRCFYGAFALVVLVSCGGSQTAGTGEFATVSAIATPPSSALDSDVATWVDATTGAAVPVACGAGSAPTTTPDDATYTIASTAWPSANTGSTSTIPASNLQITNVTFTLTPANTLTPALSPLFATQQSSPGQLIVPGTNSVSVRIASNELKSFLRNSVAAPLDCANQSTTYSYWAVASFQAREVNTNKVSTITAPALLVNFRDFID